MTNVASTLHEYVYVRSFVADDGREKGRGGNIWRRAKGCCPEQQQLQSCCTLHCTASLSDARFAVRQMCLLSPIIRLWRLGEGTDTNGWTLPSTLGVFAPVQLICKSFDQTDVNVKQHELLYHSENKCDLSVQ
ncbi:hypothetical protein ZHAS_00002246 [Anopheles sinensis]|uniref:Uncharacterized protein n=1 Tax=Anopheles sinensis TaxID=74873 RepID=A0A084VC01_ANOSI|nr:hypothetical protein ZHAS_00002246 [Anopheles sinensis]